MSISSGAFPRSNPTRKRTRDEIDVRDIDRRPFTVRHDSSDPFAKPRTFTPFALLSRSSLPLAYLDTAQDGSRLLTATVPILEACADQQDDANVLLVEDEKEGRFYAIERVKRKTYALCRLGAWVKVSDVKGCEERGQPHLPQRKRQTVQHLEDGKPWWAGAAVQPEALLAQTTTGNSVLSMLVSETAGEPSSSKSAISIKPKVSHTEAECTKHETQAQSHTPEDSLEELAKQYLDYLYLSRFPLNYFVKGPIARARAVFSQTAGDLVKFLRGSIMSSSTMDKKYGEVIAELVREIPIGNTPEAHHKRKRKKKWKPQRHKSGFFVGEKEHAEEWWKKDDDGSQCTASNETMDLMIRRRSQQLRNRETFLQIVLILEIMAMEATFPATTAATSTATEKPRESEKPAPGSELTPEDKKPRKKKKAIDIAATLESLVDRLSIWYFLESSSPVKIKTGDGAENDEAKDDLKSFAAEVVIPFYAARIPDRAYSTSRKLGGPSAPTVPKKPTSKAQRPGEPVARPMPEKKARKSLTRVSTETLTSSRKAPPVLHRSATDSDVLAPLIKRESSEVPSLESIPMSKRRGLQQLNGQRKRLSLLEQVSSSRREIDLSAMSQANAAKLRKKAEVDEKLRQVIDTIKKPNRDRAVEESARNTDESFARAIAPRGKNSTLGQLSRKPAAKQDIAVTATPRYIKATPFPRSHGERSAEQTLHSSATSKVPSSSARLFAQPDDAVNRSLMVPQTGHRPRISGSIEDTPSRGFNRFMPAALAREPGTLLESPTAHRISAIGQTPSKPISMPSLTETPICKPTLLRRTYSPVKLQGSAVTASPAQSLNDDSGIGLDKGIEGKESIYDVLGWNDGYEELA